jgi:dihydroflavonol-4-reductase
VTSGPPSAPTRGRALVLGASGHLGNAFVRALLDEGVQVGAARRGRSDARNLAGLPVIDLVGDADAPSVLDGWIAGHDLVVDAAAPYPLGADERGAGATAGRRAAALVAGCRRHGARLVHVSAFVTRVGTGADGHRHGLRQRLEAAAHPYFAAKQCAEDLLVDAARAGAPITIVNPTLCLGPWDGKSPKLALIPRLLAGEVPAVPAHMVNVVDVRDVAACALAASRRGVTGEPLLVAGHNIGLPALCAMIGELAGLRRAPWSVPLGAGMAAGWVAELARVVTRAPITPPLLPVLLVGRHVPLTVPPHQRALGAAPRSLSTTLRDAIAWHRPAPAPARAGAVIYEERG